MRPTDYTELKENIVKARQGDNDAIWYLCEHYQYKIDSIINFCFKNYKDFDLDYDDMLQDGYMGIIECCRHENDFTHNVYFFIYNSIKRKLYKNRSISMPIYAMDKYYGKNIPEWDNAFENTTCLPFEELIENNPNLFTTESFVDDFINKSLNEELNQILNTKLTPKQKEMIYLRYTEELTLQNIGDMYGLTRERVRQIIETGLDKLTKSQRFLTLAKDMGYDIEKIKKDKKGKRKRRRKRKRNEDSNHFLLW
ncbi:MAG: sigma-70 family RNA polymerase sigma factor [Bacilli bacterium]|nr:sigma-70 family RNA polymerase sigma factor [Bacilli bacterium]